MVQSAHLRSTGIVHVLAANLINVKYAVKTRFPPPVQFKGKDLFENNNKNNLYLYSVFAQRIITTMKLIKDKNLERTLK